MMSRLEDVRQTTKMPRVTARTARASAMVNRGMEVLKSRGDPTARNGRGIPALVDLWFVHGVPRRLLWPSG